MLEGEVGGRQDLGQEFAQEQLAQSPAQFGRAQDLLQARDVLATSKTFFVASDSPPSPLLTSDTTFAALSSRVFRSPVDFWS